MKSLLKKVKEEIEWADAKIESSTQVRKDIINSLKNYIEHRIEETIDQLKEEIWAEAASKNRALYPKEISKVIDKIVGKL